jgi:hypothetical protein
MPLGFLEDGVVFVIHDFSMLLIVSTVVLREASSENHLMPGNLI